MSLHSSLAAAHAAAPKAMAALLVAIFTVPAPAQSLVEGYAQTTRALPGGVSSVLVVPSGVVYFDGTDLLLDDGTTITSLLSFPSPVFGSFTVQVSPNDLLFGESSQGTVWRVPLDGSPAVQLATLPLNFAAAKWQPGWALISAKTGGFGSPDNDIVAVDLATGQVDTIAKIAGASGPIAVDPAGNVLYATASSQFPPPPASTDVLRFDAAAVAAALGPTVLTAAAATVVLSGFDSAGALALDGDGDLLVVDWANAQILEIDDIGQPSPRSAPLLDYSGGAWSPVSLQVVTGTPALPGAVLEPFQPPGADQLVVFESDFFTVAQLRLVDPARPQIAVPPAPVPPGPFQITATGGPAGGVGLWMIGAPATGPEVPYFLGGFEAPVFLGFSLLAPLVLLPDGFDPSGNAALALANPGVGGLGLGLQLLAADAAGRVLASTAPVTLVLQ